MGTAASPSTTGHPRSVAGQAAWKATVLPGAGGQSAQRQVPGHKNNISYHWQSEHRGAKKQANSVRMAARNLGGERHCSSRKRHQGRDQTLLKQCFHKWE